MSCLKIDFLLYKKTKILWEMGSQLSKYFEGVFPMGCPADFTFRNWKPSFWVFLTKLSDLTKDSLEYWWSLWGTFEIPKINFRKTQNWTISSVQFSSVTQSCPTLFDSMNCSMPGLPVHHQLPEFTETHIHRVSDAIQPSHPLSSPSPPAPIPSQHQSLFQWVNSSHEVAKVLELQL